MYVATGVILTSCGQEQQVTTFERPVKLYKVESLGYITKSYTGKVVAEQISNLAFKMGGQLVKLNVEDGQKVTKGEFIAEIDPIDYSLQLDAAKAAYINSKAQLERYQKLIAKQAISQQQLEGAQANYARDKSNYDNAISMVGETKIYAPFSGIIEKRLVDNFQRVQPAEPVVKLVNLNQLEVSFILPESNISYMSSPDKEFFVQFETYPDVQFKAKVTKFVESSPDGSGVPVTVVIDDSRFNLQTYNIKPGFSCMVFLKIKNTSLKDVTAVPITAIYSNLGTTGDNVWVYNRATSTVELQKVSIGELFGKDMIVINSGLKPGDEIVSAGVSHVVNGQKVKVLK